MQSDATAELLRPENAKGFEIAACVVPEQVRNHATVDLRVVLDGRLLGDHEFTTTGCEKLRWPVPLKPSGMVKVELYIAPPFHPTNGDTRVLGMMVSGLGFVSERSFSFTSTIGNELKKSDVASRLATAGRRLCAHKHVMGASQPGTEPLTAAPRIHSGTRTIFFPPDS